MEFEIKGKKVVLYDDPPAEAAWNVMSEVAALGTGQALPYALAVKQAQLFVESWEFEGDPRDAANYSQLGFFGLVDLAQTISGLITDRMNVSKN